MTQSTTDIPEKGEGNHKAAQAFNEKERDYIRKNPDQIAEDARKAKEALDGPEGAKLEAERARSASQSKGEDRATSNG